MKRKRHFQTRKWEWMGHSPVLCSPDEFMGNRDAAGALGRLNVSLLIARMILDPAYLEDGTPGVTRESVMRDLEWKRAAGLRRRFWRRVTGVLTWF